MFGPTPGSKQKVGAPSFPKGTAMLFWQPTAPLGWTKITSHNDKLLRIVNGIGGPSGGGGTNPFSTVNAQTAVGNTTLSTTQMPSHVHSGGVTTDNATSGFSHESCAPPGLGVIQNTGAAGGGGAHNHTITMSIQFIDLILASKN